MSRLLPIYETPQAVSARTSRQDASVPDEERTWRPDIDGLRGLAVLSLMAVHLYPQWSHGGGLVGIDMFFVISGYLITDRLTRAQDGGPFSLRAFYVRRIQRIVPSLCLVLIFCLAFSWLFTFPQATLQIGRHVVSASLFASNVMLWRDAAPSSLGWEGTPMFHLWALALGVQFLIVWPIGLVWLLRSGRSVKRAVGTLLIASFALNLAFVERDPNAAFLLPMSRAWELMVGALLACMGARGPVAWVQARLARHSVAQQQAADLMAWTGVALLGVSLWLIVTPLHFPGWWALLPTLGTFALLAAGSQAWINRMLLSQPILRFYGRISYPLYLWHWPLLCFPAVVGMPLTNELRVIILTASVVLAALTHEVVEKWFRFGPDRTKLPMTLIATLLSIGALGFVVQHTSGLLTTFPESMREGPAIQLR